MTTCPRLVTTTGKQAVRTHPDVGLTTTLLQLDCRSVTTCARFSVCNTGPFVGNVLLVIFQLAKPRFEECLQHSSLQTRQPDGNKPCTNPPNTSWYFRPSQRVRVLIYFLYVYLDPIDEVVALAKRLRQDDNVRIISLVEEHQASAASVILRTACQRGSWVVIKNCHLTTQWPADVLDIFHVSSNRDFTVTTSMKQGCKIINYFLGPQGNLKFFL